MIGERDCSVDPGYLDLASGSIESKIVFGGSPSRREKTPRISPFFPEGFFA
jgi:hypothetical protein